MSQITKIISDGEKKFEEKFHNHESCNNDDCMCKNEQRIKSFLHQHTIDILEGVKVQIKEKEYLTHDLKQSLNPCTFYSDHEPVWDGNYYTCAKCGQEFIKAKEINTCLSDLTSLIDAELTELKNKKI